MIKVQYFCDSCKLEIVEKSKDGDIRMNTVDLRIATDADYFGHNREFFSKQRELKNVCFSCTDKIAEYYLSLRKPEQSK